LRTWQLEGEELGAGTDAELAGDLPGHGHRRHRLLAIPGNARELGRGEVQLHGLGGSSTRNARGQEVEE
jgi:hypothetical protein